MNDETNENPGTREELIAFYTRKYENWMAYSNTAMQMWRDETREDMKGYFREAALRYLEYAQECERILHLLKRG